MHLSNFNFNYEKLPSNQRFGFLVSSVLILIIVYSYFKNTTFWILGLLFLITFFFVITTLVNPKTLTPLNKSWFLLGQSMGKIVSPIVLGIIFFVLITPIGLITKLLGRDELKLNRPNCQTYWVEPVGSNSDSESFKNQF